MKTKIIIIVLIVLIANITLGNLPKASTDIINNADLMPEYKPHEQVEMEDWHPEWVKSLIMAQVRIETATSEGTFQSAVKVLDHYQETGVNGLVINPIFERTQKEREGGNNGYGNLGPHTIEPTLTGKDNIDDSFKVVNEFVEEAHKRDIRIFIDVVVWGTVKESPLVTEYPEFYRGVGGFNEVWGGYAYRWSNPAWREWYINAMVDLIVKTGADGFRVDLEPDITGYLLFVEVRKRLYDKGKKILIISEGANERLNVYDFEQCGVGWEEEPDWANPDEPKWFESGTYYLTTNIVDSVKTGKGVGKPSLQKTDRGGLFRFYTYNLATHDSHNTIVRGNRVRIGYQAIFAPYIPMWFIGEEWNNPNDTDPLGTGVLYFNNIDWNQLDSPDNNAFFEDVKKYIEIRRSYPEVFEYFPDNHRESNIAKVSSEYYINNDETVPNSLQSYARFAEDKGIIIVPNTLGANAKFKISIPYNEMDIAGAKDYIITDLNSGTVIAEKEANELESFNVNIDRDYVGVYLIEKSDEKVDSTDGTPTPAEDNKTPDHTSALPILLAIIAVSGLIGGSLLYVRYSNKKR